MKKIKRRSAAALLLVLFLALGVVVYIIKLCTKGSSWVSAPFNTHGYSDGVLRMGSILDRNGVVLSGTTNDGHRYYNDDWTTRVSTLHAVGDIAGNIGSGALTAQADKLMGYDIINGVYSVGGKGNDLYLTIDSELNRVAYNALNGRKGAVVVYNYETGEVLCMVSTPAFDPNDPGGFDSESSRYSGVYMNRFLSSTFTPGSVFKLVTLSAAMDLFEDFDTRTYECRGTYDVNGDLVRCTGNHGIIDIPTALAESCNCVFAQMSLDLGGEVIQQYAEKYGLLDSFKVSGVITAAGHFEVAEDGSIGLAWSGIGQFHDLVNPAAMLRFVGAIANGGTATNPRTVQKTTTSWGLPTSICSKSTDGRYMSREKAERIAGMMRNNVVLKYGEGTFPGLDICAKSGTAEVQDGVSPHSWFVGFLRDEEHPLAFVCIVENGGGGLAVAGSITNTLLQSAVQR